MPIEKVIYVCSTCNKKFKYKKSCDRHKRMIHCNKVVLKCRFCSKKFATHKGLQKHEKRNHDLTMQDTFQNKSLEALARNIGLAPTSIFNNNHN